MSFTDRLKRLREFASGERGPYEGFDSDLDALLLAHDMLIDAAATQENERRRLRAALEKIASNDPEENRQQADGIAIAALLTEIKPCGIDPNAAPI